MHQIRKKKKSAKAVLTLKWIESKESKIIQLILQIYMILSLCAEQTRTGETHCVVTLEERTFFCFDLQLAETVSFKSVKITSKKHSQCFSSIS